MAHRRFVDYGSSFYLSDQHPVVLLASNNCVKQAFLHSLHGVLHFSQGEIFFLKKTEWEYKLLLFIRLWKSFENNLWN